MVLKTFDLGEKVIEFYAEKEHYSQAPLRSALNVLILEASTNSNVTPDELAQALLVYLREKINPDINYARSEFTKGQGAPEARGCYFVGDKPTSSNVLFQVNSYLNYSTRIDSKRTQCNGLSVIPFTEPNLKILLDYANP